MSRPDLDVGEGAEHDSMASGQRDFGLVLDPQVHLDYWADDLYQLAPGLEPGGGTENPTRERCDLPGRADQSATRLQVHDLRRGLVDERVDLPVGTILSWVGWFGPLSCSLRAVVVLAAGLLLPAAPGTPRGLVRAVVVLVAGLLLPAAPGTPRGYLRCRLGLGLDPRTPEGR